MVKRKKAKKRQEERIRQQQLPARTARAVQRVGKKAEKALRKQAKFRRILPTRRPTLVVKQVEPAPYVSRYFKQEWDEAKKTMFFK